MADTQAHTPGPWHVNLETKSIDDATGHHVHTCGGVIDMPNAYLIAAAPDLLAAALDFLDNGIEWRGGVSYKLRDASNSGTGAADKRIGALRAAIRKATGGAS